MDDDKYFELIQMLGWTIEHRKNTDTGEKWCLLLDADGRLISGYRENRNGVIAWLRTGDGMLAMIGRMRDLHPGMMTNIDVFTKDFRCVLDYGYKQWRETGREPLPILYARCLYITLKALSEEDDNTNE